MFLKAFLGLFIHTGGKDSGFRGKDFGQERGKISAKRGRDSGLLGERFRLLFASYQQDANRLSTRLSTICQ